MNTQIVNGLIFIKEIDLGTSDNTFRCQGTCKGPFGSCPFIEICYGVKPSVKILNEK
jgi:hypothetical protein